MQPRLVHWPTGDLRLCALRGGAPVEVASLDDLGNLLDDPTAAVWIDLADPRPEHVERIAGRLGIHPLMAGRLIEQSQRARIEQIDEHVHVVLFAIEYDDGIVEHEVDLVLGRRVLLTVHDSGWDPLPLAAPDATADPLRNGPDHLLYVLADGIVDGYFPVLDRIGDALDTLQDEVIAEPTKAALEVLFRRKRELLQLRRAISPTREVFMQLTNRDRRLVSPDDLVYFRDVYDHLIRATDEVDLDREIVSGTLEIYLSTINTGLAAIMKRLTGVTVILAGIGAVAGVFGMSEAATAIGGAEGPGFWVVSGVIAVAAALALAFLRRIDWV